MVQILDFYKPGSLAFYHDCGDVVFWVGCL